VPKDGGAPYKRAPEKSFTATDLYTIRKPTGERNLVIENALAQLESKFTRIRDRLTKREILSDSDRANLCLFTAAMHSRTIPAGEHWRKTQQEIHDCVVAMEQACGLEPRKSLEIAAMVVNAPQQLVAMSLGAEAPLYFTMNMTIFVTNDPVGFITSDSPCVWYNPKAHTFPPAFRSPGLAQPDIEVSLPLTPHLMLLFSHHKLDPYVDVSETFVERANRRVRVFADKEFVSRQGVSLPQWFVEEPMPDDAWENTDDGKRAIAEQSEWDEMAKEAGIE
jgi:hypothetical protein